MGVGTQDDLALAEEFVATTGIESFAMLWDESFESWQHYGVSRNSDMWLLDAQGNRVGERFYLFDEAYVTQLLAELT